ncbi:GIY-YIG nuclease family protein [bacterium]|jgi:group I intron endonuclease|nr:GIY-YIG nuclease family protein [bacterium]
MGKICGIYKITSPTKKVYIGQSLDILTRFVYYKRMACKKQTRLFHSLSKYGVKKHTFEIIHVCDKEELNDLEIYYINLFSCYNTEYGLNLRTGGSRGSQSDGTKKKLSDLAKGRKASDKARESMRLGAKKRPQMSDETKERHRISALGKNKGKKHTPETIKKMSIASTGQRHSDEFKEKLRIRNIGNKYNVGRKHSEETLGKMRLAASKRMVHPSLRSYDKGCRCDECKAIKSEYCRNSYKIKQQLKTAERQNQQSWQTNQ